MNDATELGNEPFGGYHKPKDRPIDDELSRVGPGTPCGEYLRRFWHPIMMSERLSDRPLPVRVLGEDLVLFRDLSGDVGLVHKHCSHRGMSLEFGIVGNHGIRCAYHGWCFSPTGQILETPGESPRSLLKQRILHGAYPVIDYKGLIFAYLGPPALKPAFPRLDMMELPDNEMVPWQIHSPCNWLQVSENSMDPFHTPFLHTRMSGVQFEEAWGELPVVDFHERELGFFYTNARRSGDHIWVRIHDHLLPNFSQNGALYERGEAVRYFGRASLTRWVVPIDDTNTYVIAWRNLNRRDDPEERAKRKEIGWESVDFYGQSAHRSQKDRLNSPGDWDAWTGQGAINSHQREHLGATDHGVRLLRNALRKGIRNLQQGVEPARPEAAAGGLIPTFAGDTIVRVPKGAADDRALILETSRRIGDVYVKFKDLPDGERRAAIGRELALLNVV
jgi:phenylpropionate dioxygenase-like ring-hydroxylating dioxygenase large terminal subunit